MIISKIINLFCIKFLFVLFAGPNANAETNETMPITPVTMQIAAEEGRLRQGFSEAVDSSDSLDLKSDSSSQPPINYPVGKPLEVNLSTIFHYPSFTTSSRSFQLPLNCFD